MSLGPSFAAPDTRRTRWAPTGRLGRVLRFCLDQMSGMRISFGSGGHEQKLTLTFSFLSSLVVSIVLLTILWACGAGWFAGVDRFAWFWTQISRPEDSLAVYLLHLLVAVALTLGAWLIAVVEAVGAALLLFLASASVGASVGFLFGIPRPLSENGPGAASAAAASRTPASSGNANATAASAQAPASPPALAASHGWYANTNLTQVSDWLTKIIVGVGLVEATRTADAAKYIIEQVRPIIFEGHFGAVLVMPALMLIGLIVGFMYCYLFTQLFLAALMVHAAAEVSHAVDLSETKPLAYAELSRIEAADPVVAPAIAIPGSAAPIRKAQRITPAQAVAATQMQSVPLAEVDDPASLAIWARAGAVLNQYGRAATGYSKLLAKDRSPSLLAEAARVFASAKDFVGARVLIDEASERRAETDPVTQARIAFDAAQFALYDPAPGGYRRALGLIDPKLLALDAGGGLHVLHACALGQQYADDKTLTPEARTDIRRAIRDDLRQALAVPDNRPWILYLLDRAPDGQPRPATSAGAAGIQDDDLHPFKDDPDILALLGVDQGTGPTGPTGPA